jgi:quinol monooxygenase YgiN
MINYLKQLMCLCMGVVVFSCNDTADQKTAVEKPKDTVAVPAADTAKPFKPFNVVEISVVVKDFAKWKSVFDADSVARKANKIPYAIVSSEIDKPNNVTVILIPDDSANVKAFVNDPRLKEVMKKAGVTSTPLVEYFHVLRYNSDAKENTWVTVTHKVKDFDAWVKGYDAEGAATRASFGLYDAVLARSTDDPNVVQVISDVKDMAKAKARLNDPAMKKIMTDAGVEGNPKITFYKGHE